MTPTNTSLSRCYEKNWAIRVGRCNVSCGMLPHFSWPVSQSHYYQHRIGATLHHDNCGLWPRGLFLEQEEIKSFVKLGENVRNPAQPRPGQAKAVRE